MEDLPVELWQIVFNDLAAYPTEHTPADKEAYNRTKHDLSSCTLVSRRWHDIALPYLFQDVRLTLENKSLQQIHNFFSRAPFVYNSVKKLYLSRYDRWPRTPFVTRDGTLLDAAYPGLSVILLADTLRLFPRLRHLRLVDIFFQGASLDDAIFLQERRVGKLTVDVLEIVFNICFLDYPARQRHILACFGSVNRLLIRGRTHWGNVPTPTRNDGLCVPQVRALELEDAAGTHQMLTLLKSPSWGGSCLEDVSIERINSGMTDDYPALQTFLDVVGPCLRRFRCNMARNPQDILLEGYFPARPIDLTPCTQLESLTLGFQLPASRASSAEVWSSVVETLTMLDRQPTLPPLQALSLEVEFMDIATWNGQAHTMAHDLWQKMGELGVPCVEPLLLRLCERAGLGGIVFRGPRCDAYAFCPAYRAGLALCFPELRSRGLLWYHERGVEVAVVL